MQIRVMEEEFNIDTGSTSCEQLFAEIESLLNKNQMVLQYMKVDEEMLYGDYAAFIQKHWQRIEKVQIVCQSIEQFHQTILIETTAYLERVIPNVRNLVEEFYQGPRDKSWKLFGDLIDGFQWLIESTNILTVYIGYPELSKFQRSLKLKIADLGEAMENSDFVLIADLLYYEIIPILEECKRHMIEGGGRKDAN